MLAKLLRTDAGFMKVYGLNKKPKSLFCKYKIATVSTVAQLQKALSSYGCLKLKLSAKYEIWAADTYKNGQVIILQMVE